MKYDYPREVPKHDRNQERVIPPLIVGNGIERTREHDDGLEKQVLSARRFFGRRIVQEYNANDLSRLLGQRLNRKSTYAETKAIADSLGFKMHNGSPQVPDHRMVIVVGKGRVKNVDFEHINPHTYNSAQKMAKISSGAIISGLPSRAGGVAGRASGGHQLAGQASPATSGHPGHAGSRSRSGRSVAPGGDSFGGRRVKDGPDMLGPLVGKTKVDK